MSVLRDSSSSKCIVFVFLVFYVPYPVYLKQNYLFTRGLTLSGCSSFTVDNILYIFFVHTKTLGFKSQG